MKVKLSGIWWAVITLISCAGLASLAQAQTESVLYSFTGPGMSQGGNDGTAPVNVDLIRDASGNLYGTTEMGGTYGNGAVFELVKSSQGYTDKLLYSFIGSGSHGSTPQGGLVMDAAGNLFGTTRYGGSSNSYGTVYELVNSSGTYTEKILHVFAGPPDDGYFPEVGLVMDPAGNLFGVTPTSNPLFGNLTYGIVFELVNSSGSYTYKVLHAFTGTGGDGKQPKGGLLLDAAGNLYGATSQGGTGSGTVFELTKSSGSYTEKVLYSFTGTGGDGSTPMAGLVLDRSGNLYGTADAGGSSGHGTVFKLSNSGGNWSIKILYNFSEYTSTVGVLVNYPSLAIDASGNLFGATSNGCGSSNCVNYGMGYGTVYELVNSAGNYSYKLLHAFAGLSGDGYCPDSGVLLDASGNLYGTTPFGGQKGVGAVYEIIAASPAASVLLSPSSLYFGDVLVGSTSPPETITVTNNGAADLTFAVGAVTITGPNRTEFSVNSDLCSGKTLAHNNTCTVSVTFKPSSPSGKNATLNFADNASDSPQTASLTGTGAGAVVTLAPSSGLTFASQIVGSTSSAQGVVLTNTGNATLHITGISITGANPSDFSQINTCGANIDSGDNCAISVTFTPTVSGTRMASVSIEDNASGSPQGLPLTGTGAAATGPAVALSPASLIFSSQKIGSSSDAQTITLTNSGSADLNISGISIVGIHSGDYNQTNTCSSAVAAGSHCIISVTFTPTAEGTRTASLSIADNASGSPHNVSLTATAVALAQSDFSVGASPTSITVVAGSSETTTFTVSPSNGFNATVAFACSGLPSLTSCTFSPETVTPDGGNGTTTLRIKTTAATISMVQYPGPPGSTGMRTMLALAAFFVCLLPLRRMRRHGLRLLSIVTFAVALIIPGCGGHSTHSTAPGTPAGTYTVTVIATSGSGSSALKHTAALSLTVK